MIYKMFMLKNINNMLYPYLPDKIKLVNIKSK